MLFFLRTIRRKMLGNNKIATYLLYAIGEIFLVVVGILIAVSIDDWNDERRLHQREIEILEAFDQQFEIDLMQFEEALAMHQESEKSIDLLLDHLQNDLAYHDSLDFHFFRSTRIWIDADMANHVYESLQSYGASLITNEDIRKMIVLLYEDEDKWIKSFETMYVDFLFEASESIFPTRFTDFWQGDYMDVNFATGRMTPLDFEQLKRDQVYLFFLRTQKNHLGWMIKRPIYDTRSKIMNLRKAIQTELKQLKSS